MENLANKNDPKLPRQVALPPGSIGFCYAASGEGVIFVGFNKDPLKRPSGMQSPTAYPVAIRLSYVFMDYVEIEL